MSGAQFEIDWIDRGREPQARPNPAYPNGKDMDAAGAAEQSCTTPLPYPAKRIGIYVVRCLRCGYAVLVTTAGRPDDPRSIKLPCRPPKA
jgi:hypothetical protein